MNESNGTHAAASPVDPVEQETRAAANAAAYLWGKVPRSLRGEKVNRERMEVLELYFKHRLGDFEAKRRAAVALAVLAAGNKGGESEESESPVIAGALPDEPPLPSPFYLTLQFCRQLSARERHLVRLFLDLHKVHKDDFLHLMDAIRETHCLDCGAWLDAQDAHDDCPMRDDEDDEEVDATADDVADVDGSGDGAPSLSESTAAVDPMSPPSLP